MPGFVVQTGATMLCAHGGQVQALVPSPRVSVSSAPALTQPAPFVVAGCPFTSPPTGPCVTAQWLTGSTRVLAGGQPLLLVDSVGLCAPTGVPATVVVAQTRVRAT
jgi:hypothetical protein